MGPKNPTAPARNKAPARKARKKYSHHASSTQSSSSLESATQLNQPTTSTVSRPPIDWTAGLGLDHSDIQRASMPSFAALQRHAKPTQPPVKGKRNRNLAPANAAQSSASEPELESILSQNGNLKIRLPRLGSASHLDPSASASSSFSSSSSSSAARPFHHPSENPTPQAPHPFDPARCHWRALRDVAFVMDGGFTVSEEDLCALLRFRYGKADPQMERVGRGDVEMMDRFCKAGGKEMYERNAWGLIRTQMVLDLRYC